MFKDAGLQAILGDTYIDPHFVSFIEYKNPKKCRFVRIDADIDGALKSETQLDEDTQKQLVDVFKKHLLNADIQVKAERFKSGKIPAVVNVDEFMRRMSEMVGFYGMNDTDPTKNATLILNVTNPVVSGILNVDEEKQKLIVNQIYYLAMLSYKKLSPEELSDFVEKSSQILFDYSK
jgi:molecular chaperone HtpG